MHLVRGEISELFQEKLGSKPTDDPEELMMIARQVLRNKYITADVGISGANFAIAETGMISITENEGNARLTCALPKVHVALMGIEKVLPKLEDLALFLPMLASAGAGQALTAYNSLYSGLNDPREMVAQICRLQAKETWKKVASHSGELTDRACAALSLPRILTDRDYDVRELESCDAGISECEALIAQTGSVLVSSRSSGGRPFRCCRRTTLFLPAGNNSSPTCQPRSRI